MHYFSVFVKQNLVGIEAFSAGWDLTGAQALPGV
jgi:hypothetical protein